MNMQTFENSLRKHNVSNGTRRQGCIIINQRTQILRNIENKMKKNIHMCLHIKKTGTSLIHTFFSIKKTIKKNFMKPSNIGIFYFLINFIKSNIKFAIIEWQWNVDRQTKRNIKRKKNEEENKMVNVWNRRLFINTEHQTWVTCLK